MIDDEFGEVTLIEYYSTVKIKDGWMAFVGGESYWDSDTYVISGIGYGTTEQWALLAATKSCADYLEVEPDDLELVPAPKHVKWQVFEKKFNDFQ